MVKFHKQILSEVEKAAQDGLREAGRAVLKRSRELSPEDAGDLKREGRVRVDDLTVQVSYDSLVARLQHENLDYHHDDGQAKFLEAAADQTDVAGIVADRVRRALG